MDLVSTTYVQPQQSAATTSRFNTASSEDFWEEQGLLDLVGTTTTSKFNNSSSEDFWEEQLLMDLVGTINTASPEDCWEEQWLMDLVGTTYRQDQQTAATSSRFNTASFEDFWDEEAFLRHYLEKAREYHGEWSA